MVNDIGTVYADRIDYWCTLHPEKFQQWQHDRRENGLNDDYIAVSHEAIVPGCFEYATPRIDKVTAYAYPGMTSSGSSGLLAVKTAQEEGFNRIVLAGIPLTVGGRHFFSKQFWYERDQFTNAWQIAEPYLRDSVRSLSGWTKQLLGAPTPSWLAGGSR